MLNNSSETPVYIYECYFVTFITLLIGLGGNIHDSLSSVHPHCPLLLVRQCQDYLAAKLSKLSN